MTIDTHWLVAGLFTSLGGNTKEEKKKETQLPSGRSRWNVGFVFLFPPFSVTLAVVAFTKDFTRGKREEKNNFDSKLGLFLNLVYLNFSTDRFISDRKNRFDDMSNWNSLNKNDRQEYERNQELCKFNEKNQLKTAG